MFQNSHWFSYIQDFGYLSNVKDIELYLITVNEKSELNFIHLFHSNESPITLFLVGPKHFKPNLLALPYVEVEEILPSI